MLMSEKLDRLPEMLGDILARFIAWTPLSTHVAVNIDSSDDAALIGTTILGVVRGTDPSSGMLLVYLSNQINYTGHYTALGLDTVVTVPTVRWHRANRLLLTWSAVRIVDAQSFAQQGFARTIGTGRLALGNKAASRRCARL